MEVIRHFPAWLFGHPSQVGYEQNLGLLSMYYFEGRKNKVAAHTFRSSVALLVHGVTLDFNPVRVNEMASVKGHIRVSFTRKSFPE